MSMRLESDLPLPGSGHHGFRHRIEATGMPMLDKKINIDLIVPADEAEAIVPQI